MNGKDALSVSFSFSGKEVKKKTPRRNGFADRAQGKGLNMSIPNESQPGKELALSMTSETYPVADVARMLTNNPPPLRPILGPCFTAGTVTELVGVGGLGKSNIGLALDLSVASGTTIFPSFPPSGPRPVITIASEDSRDEVHRRIHHMVRAFGLDEGAQARIVENWTLIAGKSVRLAEMRGEGGSIDWCGGMDWLRQAMDDLQPALVRIDPRVHALAGNENLNAPVAAFYARLRELTDLVHDGCCVLVTHHVAHSKADARESGTGRGASSARDASRSSLVMTQLNEQERKAFGVADQTRFVALTHAKSNYTRRMKPAYFRFDDGGTLHEIAHEEIRTAEAREQESTLRPQIRAAIHEELEAAHARGETFTRRDLVKTKTKIFDRVMALGGSRDMMLSVIDENIASGAIYETQHENGTVGSKRNPRMVLKVKVNSEPRDRGILRDIELSHEQRRQA